MRTSSPSCSPAAWRQRAPSLLGAPLIHTRTSGPPALYEFLIGQVQETYRLQGVSINDKHIEVIIQRMLRNVRISDPGDTECFGASRSDRVALLLENKRIDDTGGKPAEAEPIEWTGPVYCLRQ